MGLVIHNRHALTLWTGVHRPSSGGPLQGFAGWCSLCGPAWHPAEAANEGNLAVQDSSRGHPSSCRAEAWSQLGPSDGFPGASPMMSFQ